MTLTSLLRTIHSLPNKPSLEPFLYSQLDLTQVTSRVFVSSEPVSQYPELLYRNNINDVISYLNAHYKNHWIVINLQEESSKYEDCQLFGNVVHYPIKDHTPPKLDQLYEIVDSIQQYLALNGSNVVLIHCKAGKGRSGVVVCGYLMQKYSMKLEEALSVYKMKRSRLGGVTIGSQLRYLRYFAEGIKVTGRKCFIKNVKLERSIRKGLIPEGKLKDLEMEIGGKTVSLNDRYVFSVNSIEENDIELNFYLNGPVKWQLCGFWVNWEAEVLRGGGSKGTKEFFVRVKYDDMDGFWGTRMKPWVRLFDEVVIEGISW